MHLFSNVNDFGSNICCEFVEVKNFELIYHPIRKKANFIEWLESAEWLGSAGPVEVSKYGVMCALQSHFCFPSENRFRRRIRVSTLCKQLARLRSSVQLERRVKKGKKNKTMVSIIYQFQLWCDVTEPPFYSRQKRMFLRLGGIFGVSFIKTEDRVSNWLASLHSTLGPSEAYSLVSAGGFLSAL